MAYEYIRFDRDQLFLLPPSMADWLAEDHLAFFVIDVVGLLDLGAFHARHPNDGVGRPAYDPEMMLALLIYAYCRGVRSSRRIESLCRSDLAYRVICANLVPDHIAIARFRADHQGAIEAIFVEVLALCARSGLATLGTIAIDGTKIGADAALDANRSAESLRAEVEEILSCAQSTDRGEDAHLGLDRGDELPAELANPTTRLARLRFALAELEVAEAAAQATTDEAAAKAEEESAAGRRRRGPKPKDPRAALARAEADLAAARVRSDKRVAERARCIQAAAAQGRRLRGRQPGQDNSVAEAEHRVAEARRAAEAAPAPKPARVNLTDPTSRIMKTASGWVQGYNAQAAVNEHHLVLAAQVTQQVNDCRQLVPMMAATQAACAGAGVEGDIGLFLADAGYWSEDNATALGPERLIATTKDWKQRRAAREMGTTIGDPPEGASHLEAMEHRLRTPEGAATYATRSHTVEPVFGDTKENRGYRRFMRRGLPAVASEWSFICTTGNLLKLFRHDPSTAAAGRMVPT